MKSVTKVANVAEVTNDHCGDISIRSINRPNGFNKYESREACQEFMKKFAQAQAQNVNVNDNLRLCETLETWEAVEKFILIPLSQDSDERHERHVSNVRKSDICNVSHTSKLKHNICQIEDLKWNSFDKIEKVDASSASSKKLKLKDETYSFDSCIEKILHRFKLTCKLPYYSGSNNMEFQRISNTFRYMFFHMKSGIFVKIQNNTLKIFAPFDNKDYVNTWHENIWLDGKKYTSFTDFYEKKQKLFDSDNSRHVSDSDSNSDSDDSHPQKYTIDNVKNIKNWYANGGVMDNGCGANYTNNSNNGNSDHLHYNLPALLNMLLDLCQLRSFPDACFFINTKKAPQIKVNLSEPNIHVFPTETNIPLSREKFSSYAPIFSFYGSTKYGDFLIPSADDWLIATESLFPFCRDIFVAGVAAATGSDCDSIAWKDKLPICFFRGKASGLGTLVSDNLRLALAQFGKADKTDKEDFDIKITDWDVADKKVSHLPLTHIQFGSETMRELEGEYVPIKSQHKYKYLLYIPGYVASTRYSYLMKMNVVIFKISDTLNMSDASNNWKCDGPDLWFFPALTPWVDHIPVKSDLSDLIEQVQWAKNHDEECQKIAQNAYQLWLQLLSENRILDYWQYMLSNLNKFSESKTNKLEKDDIRSFNSINEVKSKNLSVVKEKLKKSKKLFKEKQTKSYELFQMMKTNRQIKFGL